MPEVFRFFGYSFFFYSREHEPLHIHVEGNGGIAKFEWNETEFILKEQQGIKVSDLKKIEKVINDNADLIVLRWNHYFNKED
ncbi:MAG: DUF4160 domain-containing protein [Bacteroidaceae bacterium]|nr:DUF4160 domain-containing protein [Bacteroidaceae bacterium]